MLEPGLGNNLSKQIDSALYTLFMPSLPTYKDKSLKKRIFMRLTAPNIYFIIPPHSISTKESVTL